MLSVIDSIDSIDHFCEDNVMALIKCPDCNKEISSRAQMCPFCGCPSDFFGESELNREYVAADLTQLDKEESSIKEENNNEEKKEQISATEAIRREVGIVSDDRTREEKNNTIEEEEFDDGKIKFQIIQDSERESDKYKYGKTHVLFRLANDKRISVAKTDLFYAPIRAESREVVRTLTDEFASYISKTTSIGELTKAACKTANEAVAAMCCFVVDRLISYQVYSYDVSNFIKRCGSKVYFEKTSAYKNVCSQINDVTDYADELAYQRTLERATRSRWEGGGFGVKGAIKGAITAGAMNATTEAFRGIGDRITDASDRNEVKTMMASIVNDKNKEALFYGFCSCLDYAEMEYLKILGENTGWDNSNLFRYNLGEIDAKLRNLDSITNEAARTELLMNLLAENSFSDKVVEYALSHCYEYGFDIRDLNHFVSRLNPVAFDNWKENNYKETIGKILCGEFGEKKVQKIKDYGLAFNMIDDNYRIIDRECGAYVVKSLIEAQMYEMGYVLGNIEACFREKGYEGCENYLKSLVDIGEKYNIINGSEKDDEIILSSQAEEYDLFVHLKDDLNSQVKSICIVRGIKCDSLKEAKILHEEWELFDSIYIPYNSYADYDSGMMQKVIDDAENRNFKSKIILNFIYGEDGLIKKKEKLVMHENKEEYEKSQQIIMNMIIYANDVDLFVYGSKGFLERARKIRELDKVKELETFLFPIVIYDVSDGNSFKGFIVSEKYFYNYNSLLGIGFGDKAISLGDIIDTTSAGKNRIFNMSNGKNEKVKILGAEEKIIPVLSDVYNWGSSVEKQKNVYSDRTPNESEYKVSNNESVIKDSIKNSIKKPCPACGAFIEKNAKFCTFCGNRIAESSFSDNNGRIVCPTCGEKISSAAKFCNYCGSNIG